MASRIIETVELDCTVGGELPDDASDETFLDVARVGYAAAALLEGLGSPDSAPEESLDLARAVQNQVSRDEVAADDDYVQELEDAVAVVQDVMEIEAAKDDFSAVDDELQREVIGTIAYIAPHFGIDVSLPDPPVTDEGGGVQ